MTDVNSCRPAGAFGWAIAIPALAADYNPEETVRFYALRLREAEMVEGSPQKIIAQGTDWRLWNGLKNELKRDLMRIRRT